MASRRKRYKGVEGKTVEYIETVDEDQFIYIRISFRDGTAVSVSLTSEPILYHVALFNDTTGDQIVLKDYLLPHRVR